MLSQNFALNVCRVIKTLKEYKKITRFYQNHSRMSHWVPRRNCLHTLKVPFSERKSLLCLDETDKVEVWKGVASSETYQRHL